MHVLLAIRFVFTKQARLQGLACIVGWCLFEIYSCLKRDVAVRAVDDAAGIKTPTTVVCHALDSRLVFTGEGHVCQTAATVKRRIPDARHSLRDRHARQPTAVDKRVIPDVRHFCSNLN